jgi:sialic acid synthase SpsE
MSPVSAIRTLRIGERRVGDGEPVLVIAEIGLNHNGDLDLARELIDLAVAAGADAVKFQKRTVDRCFTRAALEAPYAGPNSFGATYGEHKAALELSEAVYRDLVKHAAERQALFLVTPFDEASADLVEDLGCPAFKIASHNLTNLPLLDHVARKRRPIVLSTGMADLDEVDAAVDTIRRHHDDLVLLQCTSAYPAPADQLNLRVIPALRERFGCLVGYSAHEPEEATLYAAVALGACVLEKHFTKDRRLRGPDHAASVEPPELARAVAGIRAVSAALGSAHKTVGDGERGNRRKHHRSVVSAVAIARGARIERAMLTTKAPGTGLPPRAIPDVVGRRARRDIPADTTLTTDMLE